MKKYFLINWIIFKNAYIRDKKVPGAVFAGVMFHLVDIAMIIIFFNIIFSNTSSLAGWNFYQVLFLYAFAKCIVSINSGWIKGGLNDFATELIRRGGFDFFMTKPVNPMILVSMSRPRLYAFIAGIFEVGLCFYAIFAGHINIGLANIFWFIILAILVNMLYYFLQVLTVVPAFWFIKLWSLQDLMSRFNQVMRYPAGVFPPVIRFILMSVFPIIAISFIPAQTLFYPPKIEYIIYIILITLIFGMITNFLWKLGQSRYSSASS
ncbi:TPA: hypothetical protein DD449_01690 [Candidatus Berkelbacteria bacterium]|uniref:ABC transporter permease n=1 Tax=Berkelbacteria bacterium GW2011_GWE1_39_12 TaxID=1618337 RepID=A0A0G4B4I8_9BACT|nr:MAG: hypothetical protein UT28_C0001G0748 [Berkelbacteria bacterium GW2011_GWE1_39_12]HBO60380.1 hypothetical protein [Candidatus Berkelbacteria bacterium]